MADYINLEIDAAATLLNRAFLYIFPEYPKIGLAVATISFLLFFIYWLKSGVVHGLKISGMVTAALIFILVAIHWLGKLVHF